MPSRRAGVSFVVLSVFCALLTAACATTVAPVANPGKVDTEVFYRALEARGVDHHTISPLEDFRLGAALADHRVQPDYPDRFIEAGPTHVAICSQLHVGADGEVFGTAAYVDEADCPVLADDIDAAFRSATDAALKQWRFEPSLKCTLSEGAARDRSCSDVSSVEPVPVSRAYRFVFLRTRHGVSVSGEDR